MGYINSLHYSQFQYLLLSFTNIISQNTSERPWKYQDLHRILSPSSRDVTMTQTRSQQTNRWILGPLAGSPSLLDGLLDSHVYQVRGWAQINQKLLVLAQAPAPNKLVKFRTSSSECLFSEGQTQARLRFYNGSVKRRRAPKFIGKGRRYVVQTFVREFDLTAKSHQVELEPSMNVSDS